MRAFMQFIQDPNQYLNAGDYADTAPVTLPEGFCWVEGEPPETAVPYFKPDPLGQVEQLITQGQQLMSANPLPIDIQKQIFDLEIFIQNYYRRGAMNLIVESVQGFAISVNRTDITEAQRGIVTQLKNQMLGVFNAL
jgi:hypothetical protein